MTGWDGLPTGFVGVMRDVTAERREERHVAAERAVVRLLAQQASLEGAAAPLLEALCRELGWDAGELWRMQPDERLHVTAAWAASESFDDFLAAGARHAFEVGDGLPGQAWMSREPVWRSGDRSRRARRRRVSARPSRCRCAPPAGRSAWSRSPPARRASASRA